MTALAFSFQAAKNATADEVRKQIAAFAKREHGKILSAEPRPQSFTRFVDGVEGAREDAVRLNGVIHYIYHRLEEVARDAIEVLKARSPLGPVERGHYRDLHTMFLNGQPVTDLDGWKPGDEVFIANPMPYARKIEIGLMRMRVPGTDQVYLEAVRMMRSTHGRLVDIRFAYRNLRSGRAPAMLIRER